MNLPTHYRTPAFTFLTALMRSEDIERERKRERERYSNFAAKLPQLMLQPEILDPACRKMYPPIPLIWLLPSWPKALGGPKGPTWLGLGLQGPADAKPTAQRRGSPRRVGGRMQLQLAGLGPYRGPNRFVLGSAVGPQSIRDYCRAVSADSIIESFQHLRIPGRSRCPCKH